MRRLKKRLRRFSELSRDERVLLLRALFVVTATRITLWTCPLPVARRIAAITAGGRATHDVEQLAWAVTVAGRYIPRATCLTQALALQALLANAGHSSRLEIGVVKHSRFEAHAWVVCDGKVILGAVEAGRYSPIVAWE
jgi:hypothetical protein